MKVFFIGFNKCGTSSLHAWLCDAGVKAFHGGQDTGGVDVAIMINIAQGRPALEGVSGYDAYLDLRMLHQRFKDFDHDYPGSKFVLNTRPVDDWLRSRVNHLNGAYVAFTNLFHDVELTLSEWSDRWRRQFVEHEAAVAHHFEGRADQYARYDITTDRPADLAAFLGIAAADELPLENITRQNVVVEDELSLRRQQVDALATVLSGTQEQLRIAQDEIAIRRRQVTDLGNMVDILRAQPPVRL